MAKRKRRRKRRKNPTAFGWIELGAAFVALGLVGFGHVWARAEIRSALLSGGSPNVAIPEILIRGGGVIGVLAGGYALTQTSDTTQKVLAGIAAAAGASFVLAPGWPYALGLSQAKPLLPT